MERIEVLCALLSGEQFSIGKFPRETPTSDLKTAVERSKPCIPACFQSMIIGNHVMADHQNLADFSEYYQHDHRLSIGISMSLESIPGRYRGDGVYILQKLSAMKSKGNDAIIDAVISYLGSHPAAACEALIQVTDKGNLRVVEALCSFLQAANRAHGYLTMGLTRVINTLGSIAEPGDTNAIEAIKAELVQVADQDFSIRYAALMNVGIIATRGDGGVTRKIMPFLRDASWCLREAAATALGQVAKHGDQLAIDELRRLCDDDPEHEVRVAAAEALGHVSDQTDNNFVLDLRTRLTSEAYEHEMDMLCHQIESLDPDVRAAALKGLPHVAERGDQRAIAACGAHLQQETLWQVCELTFQLFLEIADMTDDNVLDVLSEVTAHGALWQSRLAALEMLTAFAPNDQRVVDAALARLKDPARQVKKAAKQLMNVARMQ